MIRFLSADPPPVRMQRRGPITDHIGGPGGARCECKHGKVWPEGDYFERAGGKACEVCVIEALREVGTSRDESLSP